VANARRRQQSGDGFASIQKCSVLRVGPQVESTDSPVIAMDVADE